MKCKNCGHRNPRGARCCEHCQHELNQTPAFSGVNVVLLVICAMLTGVLGGILLRDYLLEEEPETPTLIYSEPTEQTTGPTETTEQKSSIPDGTLLIEGSWETGGVTVVALDDYSLWVQITDDRPDQQYETLGTPWEIRFEYGTQLKYISPGGYNCIASPFSVTLSSLAFRKMAIHAYDNGITSVSSREYAAKNLTFLKTKLINGSPRFSEQNYEFLDVEQNGNTYTVIFTPPPGFEAPVYTELREVDVIWYDTDYHYEFHENGSYALANRHQTFYPSTYAPAPKTVDYMKLISAGQYHSVAVYEDGTVSAVGRSDRDRSDVGGWSDIVAVSAYSHTVGLRANGTVVAAGDWVDGRCSVAGWTDIIDVDTGEKNTIGLKSDGTVSVVGDNDYHQREVSSWTDIVDVTIGSRTAYGVKCNGRVVAAGGNHCGQREVGGWSDIIAISAGPYHVVGLKSDGTVVAVGDNTGKQCNVNGWTDIVAIAAGNKYTLGLKADGGVVVCGQFDSDDLDRFEGEEIVAISAGMYHVLALTKDGRVIAAGNNDRKQCDINGCDIF